MAEGTESRPTLKVQEFIRQHGPARLMVDDFSIAVKTCLAHPNLILLKYDQHKSPLDNPIVQECRGVILDSKADWRVVCYPYNKFFNFGEPYAVTDIDWSSAVVYEKYDGSLATLYHYKGEWMVASSGVPDASGSIDNNTTFRQLFDEIWHSMKYRYPKDTSKCYMFEMVSPRFPIVTKPLKDELIFHGCRDLNSLKEFDPVVIGRLNGWKVAESYPLHSIQDVVAASHKLNPAKNEGYVICDAQYRRIKVKSPSYVAVAHLNTTDRNRFNYKHMLELIRTNESDEFLAYFPQWKHLCSKVRQDYQQLATQVQMQIDRVRGEADPVMALEENLAKHVHRAIYSRICSQVLQGNISSPEMYLRTCSLSELFDLTQFLRGNGKFVASTPADLHNAQIPGGQLSSSSSTTTTQKQQQQRKNHAGNSSNSKASKATSAPFEIKFADDAKDAYAERTQSKKGGAGRGKRGGNKR